MNLHHEIAKAEIAHRLEQARHAAHVRAVRQGRRRHRFVAPPAWRRPSR